MDQGPYQAHFDVCAFFGEWHVIASVPSEADPAGYPVTSKYSQLTDSGFNMRTWNYDLSGKQVSYGHGFALIKDWCNPASMIVNYPGLSPANQPNFIVHQTDYHNFALVGSYNRSNFIVLSRCSSISQREYQRYLVKGVQWGYDVSKVVPKQGAITSCA